MRLLDHAAMAAGSITRHPLRSSMLLVAIAIGVTAVLLLTSLGEGARRYVTDEFNSLGSHLLIVTPGKEEVGGAGGMAGAISGTPRPLTLQDSVAIERSPYVANAIAFIQGSGRVNYEGVEREISVLGTTHHLRRMFDYAVARGRYLPELELDNASPVGVIGHTIAGEIFGSADPVGKWVRVGDRRMRVIGVMDQAGVSGGLDVDETIFVPVGFAMQIFDRDAVQKLIVETRGPEEMEAARKDIVRIVRARHQGHDDVTVMDQGAVLETFNTIFGALTAMLAGIASISLAVAGTLIMNVMLVAVSQRTAEIGLMKALGARRRQIIALFLLEAAFLSLLGGLAGLIAGQAAIGLLRELYPLVDFQAPDWAVSAALLMALGAGLVFGILPARRAADLDPVEALAGH